MASATGIRDHRHGRGLGQRRVCRSVRPCASPYGGFFLPACGPYRFVATVGDGSPAPELPAIVLEAFRRLVEYMAAPAGEAGARQSTVSIESISESYSKSEAWTARAMQNSGAADLLRSFRRC